MTLDGLMSTMFCIPLVLLSTPEYLNVDMGANGEVSADVVKYIMYYGRGSRSLQIRVRAFSQTNLSGHAQNT
jgi:hypothetical protein